MGFRLFSAKRKFCGGEQKNDGHDAGLMRAAGGRGTEPKGWLEMHLEN
jgi:hypothetical protein